MSTPELEPPPLSPELLGLLDQERTTTAPEAAKARVLRRVLVELGPVAGGPSSDPGPGLAKGATPWASVKVVGAVAFALGALTGGTTIALLQPPSAERIVYVDRPTPEEPAAPRPIEPAAAPTREREAAPPPKAPPTPRAKGPAAAPAIPDPPSTQPPEPPRPEEPSREQALLERARSALARGRANDAALALTEHQEHFPNGQFREEREGLWVLTLWARGDRDEARARAAQFKAQFPNSLLGPAIEARLR